MPATRGRLAVELLDAARRQSQRGVAVEEPGDRGKLAHRTDRGAMASVLASGLTAASEASPPTTRPPIRSACRSSWAAACGRWPWPTGPQTGWSARSFVGAAPHERRQIGHRLECVEVLVKPGSPLHSSPASRQQVPQRVKVTRGDAGTFRYKALNHAGQPNDARFAVSGTRSATGLPDVPFAPARLSAGERFSLTGRRLLHSAIAGGDVMRKRAKACNSATLVAVTGPRIAVSSGGVHHCRRRCWATTSSVRCGERRGR